MQKEYDRVILLNVLSGEDASEVMAAIAKTPERIAADGSRPVDAGNGTTAARTIVDESESGLDDVWQAVVLELLTAVVKTFWRCAAPQELLFEMIFTDWTKGMWFDWAGCFAHTGEQPYNLCWPTFVEIGKSLPGDAVQVADRLCVAVLARPRNSEMNSRTVGQGCS
jgi:hypothetical protein